MSEYQDVYDKMKLKVILIFKRIYVVAFNFYAWFWLYRLIFIKQSTSFEDYLIWFFATFGMYIFILEHKEIFFEIKKTK
jgi:hypothetical protein